MLDKLNK